MSSGLPEKSADCGHQLESMISLMADHQTDLIEESHYTYDLNR